MFKDVQRKKENHKALFRAKEQIEILTDTLYLQSMQIDELDSENKRLKKEKEHLDKKHEQLEERYGQLEKKYEQLEKEHKPIKRENERLKKDLLSARKPPKWAKENKKEGRKKCSKKRKSNREHKPSVRKRPEQWEQEINITPLGCPNCTTCLPKPHKWHEHFQKDLPEPKKPITTRYIVGWSWCKNCNKEVSISEKLGHSLYGPCLHAKVSYWKFDLGLTYGKIHRLLLDEYGLEISRGVLSDMVSRTAKEFTEVYGDIRAMITEGNHIHGDETGWRLNGKNHWLWSFSSDEFSFYRIDPTRSKEVVRNVLGEKYHGVLITDFYASYNEIKCSKQRCWAHLLRELKGLKKDYPRSNEIKVFFRRAKNFFRRSKALQEDFLKGSDIEKRLKRIKKDTEGLFLKKWRHKELKRICKRLKKHREELYTFVQTKFEPTNNNGERDIRPAVLLRKISYCNRSPKGVHNQEVMMSVIQTARKQGVSFVDMATKHLSQN